MPPLTSRGAIRPTTRADAVGRALSMVGFEPDMPANAPSDWESGPIRYRLERYNGGKNPYAPHPADWSYGRRTPTCDCVGLVTWALGFDRFQRAHGFSQYGGWVNTDSMVLEATRRGVWFELIDTPEPGCLIVTRSVRKGYTRVKVGHVGLVVSVPAEYDGNIEDLRVVHCSSSASRKLGAAVQETDGTPWRRGPHFVRYRKAA